MTETYRNRIEMEVKMQSVSAEIENLIRREIIEGQFHPVEVNCMFNALKYIDEFCILAVDTIQCVHDNELNMIEDLNCRTEGITHGQLPYEIRKNILDEVRVQLHLQFLAFIGFEAPYGCNQIIQ